MDYIPQVGDIVDVSEHFKDYPLIPQGDQYSNIGLVLRYSSEKWGTRIFDLMYCKIYSMRWFTGKKIDYKIANKDEVLMGLKQMISDDWNMFNLEYLEMIERVRE